MDATQGMLVNELTHGRRLARELESQLSSASAELCESLVKEILASIERAISMAQLDARPGDVGVFTDSPGSDSSEPPPFKADRKKRKTQPKWTNQVKLGSGPAAEGPLDDGHSWRKYGQKEILGAKHPRGYYRCTHRNTQGCPAMKQVQRSDDDPAIFHVTYRGTHTCRLRSFAAAAGVPNPGHNYNNQLLISFQNNLKVETEALDSQYHQGPPSPSLLFPATPIDCTKPAGHVFSPASTLDNCFKRSFTDAFISPATPESGFTEMVSGATSPSNSCMLDLDFLLQSSAELDAEFTFDDMSFFHSWDASTYR